jgi:plasmid stabilization system protein ParE
MAFTIIVKEEAHQDTLDAYWYYEKKQKGLGERFLDLLQSCYEAIAQHPTHYGYINEDPQQMLRDVKIDKFPFVIVYEIIEEEVIIYAVHNTYRHPKKKGRK